VADLPDFLRQSADQMESRPAELWTSEPEGWEGYGLWAATYDHEPDNPVIAGEEQVIWELIGEADGLDVLDVGCGTGRHVLPLAAQGARVLGLEPAAGMLQKARRKAEERGLDVDLRRGAIENLGPELGRFDLVLCCLVLSHVEDLEQAISSLAARLRPGGRLIVSDFHPSNLLIGWRTSFCSGERKFVVPNYIHLPCEYFGALEAAGLRVSAFHEVAMPEEMPRWPMTLVMAGTKEHTGE
jgi:malonyl-CoA O-methyltransferase